MLIFPGGMWSRRPAYALKVRQNGKSLVASFQKNSFIKGRVATTPF